MRRLLYEKPSKIASAPRWLIAALATAGLVAVSVPARPLYELAEFCISRLP